MKNTHQVTKEGYQKLKKELSELINIKKPQAIQRLQKARAMGDLSENSEYSSAKENLEFIENRINELQEIIKKAQIADSPKDNQIVELGESVVVESDGGKKIFTIVGEYEANPLEGKISASSPIGQGLLGKKIGDQVEINIPAGKIKFRILEIKK